MTKLKIRMGKSYLIKMYWAMWINKKLCDSEVQFTGNWLIWTLYRDIIGLIQIMNSLHRSWRTCWSHVSLHSEHQVCFCKVKVINGRKGYSHEDNVRVGPELLTPPEKVESVHNLFIDLWISFSTYLPICSFFKILMQLIYYKSYVVSNM